MSPSIDAKPMGQFKCPLAPSPIKLNQNNIVAKSANQFGGLGDELDSDKAKQSVPSKPFQLLLKRLNVIFSQPESSAVDADEVYRILDEYQSNREDWAHYAFYDQHHYKRNLIDEGENYNVMILGWGPGVTSSIHDHPGAHCFMKLLDGELVESRYAWPSQPQGGAESPREMQLIAETRSRKNDVIYINDHIGLHQVSNPDKTRTCTSLHVYVPPFKQCRAFDQKTGQPRECKLTFYSKRGIVLNQQQSYHPKTIEH